MLVRTVGIDVIDIVGGSGEWIAAAVRATRRLAEPADTPEGRDAGARTDEERYVADLSGRTRRIPRLLRTHGPGELRRPG